MVSLWGLFLSLLIGYTWFITCNAQNEGQSTWFQMEPALNKSMIGTFAAIYNDTLFLIGGLNYTEVTTISLK